MRWGFVFIAMRTGRFCGVGQTPVPGTPDPMVIQTPGGSHSSDRGGMELATAGGITTSKTASICVVE